MIGDLLRTDSTGPADPAWLVAVRGAAKTRVEREGLPGRSLETWRYSGTKRLLGVPWVHESGALYEAFAGSVVGSHTLRGAVAELVFVNGVFSPSLSHIGGASGLTVEPLSQSFVSRDLSERLTPRAGAANGFDALNVAMVRDGVFIDVAPDAEISEPVHLIFVTVGEGAHIVCQPRVVVQVGRHAKLTLVERHVGTGSQTTFTNIVSDVHVDDGGALTHHLWRLGNDAAHHVGQLRVDLGRDARLHSHTAWLGGAWVRQDLDVRFTAPGAEADCSGIYVVDGSNHLDNHTWLRHQAPRCTSRETYHGVLGGRAKAVFNGMVRIDRGAIGTDASLYNRNLLLSDHATVYSKPELEIFADDVKAAHGCTVGQLDPEQLTYLRSRGLDRVQARQLLTRAFLVRVLDAIQDDALREVSNDLVTAALDALSGEQS